MNTVTYRLLTSWEVRPFLFLFFLGLGLLYTAGWVRLRRRGKRRKLAASWRLAFYWAALFLLIVALMSPLDVLSADLFFMHMIQHLVMTMISAPLLMLANPMPFLIWGLPDRLRHPVGRFLTSFLRRRSPIRERLRTATHGAYVWVVMVGILWGWHDFRLYNLAQGEGWIHDLEHLTFYGSALLYWWRVTGAGPRLHPRMSRGGAVGYLLAGIPATFVLGVGIAFSTTVIYTYYETRPRLLGLSVLDDQTIGGIIMWVGGSMMYLMAALIVVGIWLYEQEKRPVFPRPPEGHDMNKS